MAQPVQITHTGSIDEINESFGILINRGFLMMAPCGKAGNRVVRTFSVLLASFLIVHGQSACDGGPTKSTDEPNAVAILRGLEQARSIESGHLRMNIQSQPSTAEKPDLDQTLEISFSAGNRYFAQTSKELLVYGKEVRKIDDEIEPTAGQSEIIDFRSRTIYDGESCFSYEPRLGASRFDFDHETTAYTAFQWFDPRAIGLDPNLAETDLHDYINKLTKHGKIILVGEEATSEHACFHIRWEHESSSSGYGMDFWIDARNNFRLYKHALTMSGLRLESRCEYPDEESVLPSKISIDEFDGNHVNTYKFTFTTKVLSINEPIPPETFSLTALDMPHGMPIYDRRGKGVARLIGYWDGARIVKQKPEHIESAAMVHRGEKRSRIILLVIANFLIVGIAVFLVLLSKRRSSLRATKGPPAQ